MDDLISRQAAIDARIANTMMMIFMSAVPVRFLIGSALTEKGEKMTIDIPSPNYCDGCKAVDLGKTTYQGFFGNVECLYKCENEELCAYLYKKWSKDWKDED